MLIIQVFPFGIYVNQLAIDEPVCDSTQLILLYSYFCDERMKLFLRNWEYSNLVFGIPFEVKHETI
jgi:hypothetical protein